MGGNPAHRAPEHFQARGIAPMHILEDHQHRSRARQRLYLPDERLQRRFPALLRNDRQRRIAAVVRQRQHVGKQRGVRN
jgi:hypothetical protein